MILLALAAAASAPSFDCAKAGTAVERLICSDAQLARLDASLASAYRNLPKKDVDEQRAWMKDRDACRNRACLIEQYETRLTNLVPVTRIAKHYTSPTIQGDLHLLSLGDRWFAFQVIGLWPTPGGSVNIADASGVFRLNAAGISVREPADEFDCGWQIERSRNDVWQITTIPAKDMNVVSCYGWNATIDGVYRRAR